MCCRILLSIYHVLYIINHIPYWDPCVYVVLWALSKAEFASATATVLERLDADVLTAGY